MQRKEKIEGLEQGILSSEQGAKDKEDEFASGLKGARSEGLKQKAEYLREADDEEKAIIDKINRKAQENLAEVRSKVAKDADAVRASLQKEVDVFANAIGEKILGRTI